MARGILSEYGPDADKKMAPRASTGGVKMPDKRDVMNYRPPVGPTNINDPQGPGLHGKNYDVCGTQGPYSTMGTEVGGPGIKRLGGEGRGKGENRRG